MYVDKLFLVAKFLNKDLRKCTLNSLLASAGDNRDLLTLTREELTVYVHNARNQ